MIVLDMFVLRSKQLYAAFSLEVKPGDLMSAPSTGVLDLAETCQVEYVADIICIHCDEVKTL